MPYHMTAADIFAYWKALREGNLPPLRSSIAPSNIRGALPDLFMLDVNDGDVPVFRLAGTRICALFAQELRGLPFAHLWAQGQADNAVALSHAAIQYACPFLLNVTGFTTEGVAQRFDVLLLPLRSSTGNCDRLMGALVAQGHGINLSAEATLSGLYIDRSRPLADIGDAIRVASTTTRPVSAAQTDTKETGKPVIFAR